MPTAIALSPTPSPPRADAASLGTVWLFVVELLRALVRCALGRGPDVQQPPRAVQCMPVEEDDGWEAYPMAKHLFIKGVGRVRAANDFIWCASRAPALESRRRRPASRNRAKHSTGRRTTRASSAASGPGDGDGDGSSGGGDDDGEQRSGRVQHVVRHVNPKSLKLHARAGLVPEMSAAEFAALARDILFEGVREPLHVVGRVVLDGRHRLRAALEVGLKSVPVVDVELGDESEASYLLRTALHRRHLSDGQRAMLAARWALETRAEGGTRVRGAGRARFLAAVSFTVSEHRVRDALELQRLDARMADEVLAGRMKLGRALAQAKREVQLRLIAKTCPPEGKYRTLVVDPPWAYDDGWCNGGVGREYVTMSDAEVAALPVAQLADETSHLYLWAGAQKLEAAFAALRAWGFEFKTLLVWKKNRLGLGRYFRSQTEYVLFGTKGRAPLRETALSNHFEAPVTKHSVKPDVFYALVERASFEPRLDMFARRLRPGWTCWGAEAGAPVGEGEAAGARPPAIHNSGTDIKPLGEVAP